MKTNGVSQLVREVVQDAIDTCVRPWPKDITDRACLAIQNDPGLLSRYDELVANYGKLVVNSLIGKSVLDLTGLRNLGERKTATSRLIKSYTCLG